jgi:hypothetical protein
MEKFLPLGVLKGSNVSAALRMAFITGISKFSLANIYSGLNNLNDLTMQNAFGAMLGFTEDELHLYFDDNIKNLAKKLKMQSTEIYRKIQDWYSGYCFATKDVHVYNPFSIINLFKFKEFKNYWAETGTPSFLVNLIKQKKYFEKHTGSGKKILLMGIKFDTEQRRIVDWKMENV